MIAICMDASLFIFTTLDTACRQMKLNELTRPTWAEAQSLRNWTLQHKQGDLAAWSEFQSYIESTPGFCVVVRSIQVERLIVVEGTDATGGTLKLPAGTKQLSVAAETRFLISLWLLDREFNFDAPTRDFISQLVSIIQSKDTRFTPPSKTALGELMYIEMKPGLAGHARIGRVQVSQTRKTIYYQGRKLQSLKGRGYKANYRNVESGMKYWLSRCRKDGNVSLYGAIVEIDDDVRSDYWIDIRQEPHNSHLTQYRSPGKHSKRAPR